MVNAYYVRFQRLTSGSNPDFCLTYRDTVPRARVARHAGGLRAAETVTLADESVIEVLPRSQAARKLG